MYTGLPSGSYTSGLNVLSISAFNTGSGVNFVVNYNLRVKAVDRHICVLYTLI